MIRLTTTVMLAMIIAERPATRSHILCVNIQVEDSSYKAFITRNIFFLELFILLISLIKTVMEIRIRDTCHKHLIRECHHYKDMALL